MSKTTIAINGFGRIGRLALRQALQREDVEVAAVNDLADNAALAYLFKNDSVHGRYGADVRLDGEDTLVVGDRRIPFTSHRDPRECGWGDHGVDVVLECTGVFTLREQAAYHLEAGARRVLISAPSKDPDVTICLGVNHEDFEPSAHLVISNASCTTNCVASPLKALHEAFGVVNGLINTVHAYTISQGMLDKPAKKWRRGRAAAVNLVPTDTGAARAVGEVMPSLKGKLDGLAIRTPNPNGSIADITLQLTKDPSIDEIHATLRAFEARYPHVLEVSDEELVSTDIIGNTHSSIVDTKMSMKCGGLYKLLCWYDNEAGYATRLVDMSQYVTGRG